MRIDTLDAMVARRHGVGYQDDQHAAASAERSLQGRLRGVRWSGRDALRSITDTSTWVA